MGTYKGNIGNLMQHWTLCEILEAAKKQDICGLNYIDAHAMAPLADGPEDSGRVDAQFAWVQRNLPGQNSIYERAWCHLVPQGLVKYPSSAAFVQQVWNSQCWLLLCEADRDTAVEIRKGLPGAQLYKGDWRDRFACPLPNPPKGSLTLVSFDPDMYDRHPPDRNPRNLYPENLELVLRSLKGVDGATLLQVSTYSRGRRNDNPQGAVISSVNSVLFRDGFKLASIVIANQDMMSLVYARGVRWATQLAGLPDNFTSWLAEVKRRMRERV